jgi:metal-responsive CopG/Arc/MetJ family transcriptional regulator
MEKTTLYLPRELQGALKEASRRTGKAQAELVREAIRAYLEELQPPRPRSIGIVHDGRLDARDTEAWLRDNWNPR